MSDIRAIKEVMDYIIKTGKCPSCGRLLKLGTLDEQCKYCYGIYIDRGELRVSVPPNPY